MDRGVNPVRAYLFHSLPATHGRMTVLGRSPIFKKNRRGRTRESAKARIKAAGRFGFWVGGDEAAHDGIAGLWLTLNTLGQATGGYLHS